MPDIKGNVAQLGGDFAIDSQGIIQFAHQSGNGADRPAIDSVLSVLNRIS